MAFPTFSFWVRKQTPENYKTIVRQNLLGSFHDIESHFSKLASLLKDSRYLIDSLNSEWQAITQAFETRWNCSAPLPNNIPSVSPPSNLDQWLKGRRKPWFRSSESVREKERNLVSQRLYEIEKRLISEFCLIADFWNQLSPSDIPVRVRKSPPLIAGIMDSQSNLPRVNPGEGPLVIQVGEAAWSIEVSKPQTPSYCYSITSYLRLNTDHTLPPASPFPTLIDLVDDGGFITDHRVTVESAVIRLLALLPAGQLKVHLFDPVKVGASLKFLSDLGNEARAAIADVRVLTADLEPLLNDLTRHVARVTQQYLGSRHKSLTEYNSAAGEVTEAYHLLILMDFPVGLVSEDSKRKLDILINAGPACGVFTFIFSEDPRKNSFGLPVLRNGMRMAPSDLIPTMQSVLPTLPNRIVSLTLEDMGSEDWRNCLALIPVIIWRGSSWSPSTTMEARKLVSRLDKDITNTKPRSLSPKSTARRLHLMPGRGNDADPDDPFSWWRKKAIHGVEATIGVTGDRDVAMVVLESAGSEPGLLIGGQPGTGKSVLLHALICDLVRNYSPDELELYLLDPKQGVEFNVYASGRLPHAKVVTVKAPAESTILVLENLIEQISDRGRRFRAVRTLGGANPDKLDDYLSIPGVSQLPRIVAVIDEFQALLNMSDDETSIRASGLLERIIREGRAFGIHLVLATQSLQGVTHLPAAVSNMIGSKVILRVSEDDSRIFLGPHDLDAARLGKASGKAILKRPGIEKREIQVTNETKDSAFKTVKALSKKASDPRRPVVLDFSQSRPPSEINAKSDGTRGLELLVARGLGVSESVVAKLPLNEDGHLLVVAGNGQGGVDATNLGILSAMIATCVASKVPFDIVDFGDIQTPFDIALREIQNIVAGPLRRFARKNLFELYLEESRKLAEQNGTPEFTRKVLFLTNAHRSRDLIEGRDVAYKLSKLLDVAAIGRVHVILHVDTGVAATRILSHADLSYKFGIRLLSRMDADSSFQLVGSSEAERLFGDELLLCDQEGKKTKAVAFAPLGVEHWKRIT